jgi:hypothetical protein
MKKLLCSDDGIVRVIFNCQSFSVLFTIGISYKTHSRAGDVISSIACVFYKKTSYRGGE